MKVVVLTRGGYGDAWLHDTVRDADIHPITQYGDPILASADDLRAVLRLSEVRRVAESLGDRATVAEAEFLISAGRSAGQAHDMLWETLLRRAPVPPADPAEIVSIVRRDREWTRENGMRVFPEKIGVRLMSEAELTEGTEAVAKPEKVKKERAPLSRRAKYHDDRVINFGANEEGVAYNGTDKNPKRPGSKAFDMFSRYRNGMTVREAKDAGLDGRDFDFDLKRGFITMSD